MFLSYFSLSGAALTSCTLHQFHLNCFASVFLLISLVVLLLQIWNLKPGWGSRPDIHVQKGHSDDITALKFSSDGRILLSRSFDGSLKVVIDVSIIYCFTSLNVHVCMLVICHCSYVIHEMCIRCGICAK